MRPSVNGKLVTSPVGLKEWEKKTLSESVLVSRERENRLTCIRAREEVERVENEQVRAPRVSTFLLPCIHILHARY